MTKNIDKHGNPKIAVKLCNSAGCEGNELGCSSGDCRFSKHHAKSAKWRYWTIERFRKIFGREPR